MNQLKIVVLVVVLLVGVFASMAFAQEPTYMNAATHPGTSQLYLRLLGTREEYGAGTGDAEASSALWKVAYGIRPTLAFLVDGEWVDTSAGSGESGIRQTTLQLKYRLFKRDLGPLNTWRTSVFGGVTIPGEVHPLDSGDAYPRGAVASTMILHRHGINAELAWEEYGELPDEFEMNASYLYRLVPAEYAITTTGAWYTMTELLHRFNDDGKSRSDVALGVLYEARSWAWELSAKLPLSEDWGREYDYTVTVGLRYLP